MATTAHQQGLDLMHKGDPVREEVLTALRDDIRATSLRAVARSTGLSPTGLSRLINSGRAYKPSRDRLDIWFMKREPTAGATIDPRFPLALAIVRQHGYHVMSPQLEKVT